MIELAGFKDEKFIGIMNEEMEFYRYEDYIMKDLSKTLFRYAIVYISENLRN